MDNIKIQATNAFGIKKLDYNFNVSKRPCIAIYAPNGTCKSSLRKAINTWKKGVPATDAFFPNRQSAFNLTTAPANALSKESIFCFQSMGDLSSARFFDDRLLASPELKKRYMQDKDRHDSKLNSLLSSLRKEIAGTSGFLKDEEMSTFITELVGIDDLGKALATLSKAEKTKNIPAFVTKYQLREILGKHIENALNKPGVKEAFTDYARIRNKVLAESLYFNNGFDYLSASALASELEKSKFFDAGHSVVLRNRNNGSTKPIYSISEFRSAIDTEVKRADSDSEVVKHFITVEEKLGKTPAIKNFKKLIEKDSDLASAMKSPEEIKLAYLSHAAKVHKEEIDDYLKCRRDYLRRMSNFHKELDEERNGWDRAVETFLNRFQIPVKPLVKNRSNVVLGTSEPVIAFEYEGVEIDNDTLLANLSDGERKALYLLSIIFDIERSKHLMGPKLYVFDDVVDSFDCINKYAFIEYLRDFTNTDGAHAILLTHNYDFFRTVTSRLNSAFGRKNCLVAEKSASGAIHFKPADFIKSSPLANWKEHLDDDVKKIASIAMVRELVAMKNGSNHPDYALLSSVLHGRNDGLQTTFKELNNCFVEQIGRNDLAEDDRKVQNILIEACSQIAASNEPLELQDKITLSIGIRTLVERHIRKSFESQSAKQPETKSLGKLIGDFGDNLPIEYSRHASCMEQAAIIVAENIHVNGFMYEPLIDIGSHRFTQLFKECTLLD